MEKTNHHYTYPLIFSLVFILAILAFVFCIIAEFKKSKVKDVKLDANSCELPKSKAFDFGIAALICFSIAQIIGNLIIFLGCCPNSTARKSICKTKKITSFTTIPIMLLVLSWVSFGISMILISTSSSMNKRQRYGQGWVDGECYIVKDGVFIGASILVLLSLGCTLATILRNKFHVSTNEKRELQTVK